MLTGNEYDPFYRSIQAESAEMDVAASDTLNLVCSTPPPLDQQMMVVSTV